MKKIFLLILMMSILAVSVTAFGASREITNNDVVVTVNPSGVLTPIFTVEETLGEGLAFVETSFVTEAGSSCAVTAAGSLFCDIDARGDTSEEFSYSTIGSGLIGGEIDGVVDGAIVTQTIAGNSEVVAEPEEPEEETPTTEDCTTVTDDDEDGALNCADKDCNEHSSCVLNVVIGTSTCDNGIDDNDDGKIDYAGGCDTDGDGKLDLRGSGITSKTSCLTAIGFSITDAIELKPIKTTKGFSTVQTSGFREIFENADAPIRTTTESGSSSSLLDSVLDVDYYALDENCENITSSEVAVDPEVGSREDFLTAIGTLYDQAETDGWSLPLVSQVAFLLREAFLTE
ncbi:hypothetical protein HOI26_04105 [Candidatus Woesearchaeota archaeon]|nr:hypothetical protein [Candidatus Woesearchaeota archaeon]